MAKRRHMIIISDDDHDNDDEEGGHRLPCQKPPLVPQGRSPVYSSIESHKKRSEKCRPSKRKDSPSINLGGDLHSPNHGITAEMQGVEYQSEMLNMQPWAEKYCPKELSDLAVHNRKVADVREWMEAKLQDVGKLHAGGNVLVLSGSPGAGKTAVVRVLVDLLDVELCEWDPPIPTLWKEHLHHVNPDVPYTSKVNEFVAFLEKVKKYPSLPLVQVLPHETNKSLSPGPTPSGKPKVLLLDDLPIVHGREFANKLCHCLHDFAASVQFPTIVIVTDFLETRENGQGTNSLTADIQQALESGGAMKITFNPITANAIRKVLTKILLTEKCMVSSESVSFIAESCGGDIRHAIYCLQFLCIGHKSTLCTWDPGGGRSLVDNPKRRKVSIGGSRSKKSSQNVDFTVPSIEHNLSIGCRDGVLSLFHALGKVLYNKRLTEKAKDSGKGSINFIIKDDLQRHPLNMEAPEKLLSQCHAEAGSFLSFLHENLLEFVDDEGIEDVSVSMSYFSDVDCLLGLKYKGPKSSARYSLPIIDEIDPGNVTEAVAGSVAARGVLFANTHPGKHRWQSLRAPVMRQVDRFSNEKKAALQAKSWDVTMESLTMVTHAVQATECEPYYKHLISTSCRTYLQPQMPCSWKEISELSKDICEDEPEIILASSQERELLSDILAIDIRRRIDEASDCDDEIEEW